MSTLRLRTVDAFTDRAFTGNPAGVLRLDRPPSESWLQALAAELNLAETAYVLEVQSEDADFGLRWFTPAVEVDLCGHATLAAAHCLLADGVPAPIRFATRSGVLTVSEGGEGREGSLVLDFPARPAVAVATPDGLAEALGAPVRWVGRGGTDDLLVELADESSVRTLRPDIAALATLDVRGVIVTALADEGGADDAAENSADAVDFVSRFFAPRVGVPEDPVTGSAHTVLAPFWADRLGRDELTGRQLSARGGLVGVRLVGDRVLLSGRAVTVLDGFLSAAAQPPSDPAAQPSDSAVQPRTGRTDDR